MAKGANRATRFFGESHRYRDPFYGILIKFPIVSTVLQVIQHILPIINLIKDYSGPTFVSLQDDNVLVPIQRFECLKLLLVDVIPRGFSFPHHYYD